MSQENVELVRSIQPPPDVDLNDVFLRNAPPDVVATALAAPAPAFTDDFVCIFHALSADPRPGVAGLRDSWLDWLEPWETYRAEIDELIDLGDRVLLSSRDYARRPGMTDEVEMRGSALYTLRGGRIAKAEFFPQRADAFIAAGLEPPD